MKKIHVCDDVEIERARRRTLKLLQEFPELWNFNSYWGVHGWKNIVVRRAPLINFLKDGIRPFPGRKSIKAYIVDHGNLRLKNVAITNAGNPIIGVDGQRIDDSDGIALRQLLFDRLSFGDNANHVPYIFLVEEGDNPERRIITVVKPPAGQKNFRRYVEKLSATLDVAA